jgi:HK97 family phage portal protein
MGFLDRYVRAPLAAYALKSLGSRDLQLLIDIYGTRASKSGQTVTAQTALEVTTALGCARVLAEGVAQVPLKLYQERAEGGYDVAESHPLFDVLYRKPNDWQTSFAFRETMMLHLVMCGNFIGFKVRVRGQVAAIIPIQPGRWRVTQNPDYSFKYELQNLSGQFREIPASEVWHVRGPSWNSWLGLEAVKLAREALGLALATEEHHARMHSNAARPGGIYSVEGKLSPEEHKRLTKWIGDTYAGAVNDQIPMVVDRGAKWHDQQMKGVDAQHLETRKFQIEEICRAFRVMPIMVGHSDKTATYASAEQMFLAHVMYSLLPWGTRIEQSIQADLLDPEKDIGVTAKFNWNGLQRGAFKDRTDAYSKALGSGGSPAWMTPNEIRALEEMNPIAGGDELPKPTAAKPADDKPADDADDKPKPEPAPEE